MIESSDQLGVVPENGEDARVLVVDDEPIIRELLAECLEGAGYRPLCVGCAEEGLKALELGVFDLILTDMKMPGITGLEFLYRIREHHGSVPVILMTGFGTVESAVEAIKLGAFDYVLKPFRPQQILMLIERALEKERLERENIALRETVGFYSLSEALSSPMGIDEQLSMVVSLAREHFSADAVSLVVADPENPGQYLEKASLGAEGLSFNLEPLLGEFSQGRDVVAHGDRVCSWMRRSGGAESAVHSFMAVPLKVRGFPLGVLSAVSFSPRVRFSEGQRKGLSIFGSRAASAVENARMFDNLQDTFTQTMEAFQRALEAKDSYTQGHSDRVAMYSRLVAEAMGLPTLEVDRIDHGGLMHDIGKIGIRTDQLNKPQRLTPEEYETIKTHPVHGKRILEPIGFLKHLVPCVYHHHEAWDGNGYPAGLEAEEIPLEARILAVADTYDAMTTDRPYRKALPHMVAIAELRRFSGRQFDPAVVTVFCDVIEVYRDEQRSSGQVIPD
jgi:response regulator RpfG family c-di-GMP phosphodiesterase